MSPLQSTFDIKPLLRRCYMFLLTAWNMYFFFQAVPLLESLVQLVKISFTKASQRLDGIYALFSVAKIASIDSKGGVVFLPSLLVIVDAFSCNFHYSGGHS